MKNIIMTLFITLNLFAVDLVKLPLLGVDVSHTYLDGKIENITIQREVHEVCMSIPVNVDNFQSANLASKDVDSKCKKTFVTTKGLIQPFQFHKEIKTIAELEVLDFILNKSSKNPAKYILVDSRKSDWFNAGTIPSAINIPYDELEYDEDFEMEFERAYKNLGVKILGKNKYDFKNAKELVLFCNGAWCPQSTFAIENLIKIGYPEEKISWYRGGMYSWTMLNLTTSDNN